MSKVVKRALAIEPSDSEDVVGYKLYAAANTDPPHEFGDADVGIDIGMPPEREVEPGVVRLVVNLDAVPEVVALGEGKYDFAITAVDDVGNESDYVKAEPVELDLTPPAPPKSVSFIAAAA